MTKSSGCSACTGRNPDAAHLSAAVTKLRNEQNPDGGWSQVRGLDSDAYVTGQVLVALHEAGGVCTDDALYQRGVKYLLETTGAGRLMARSYEGSADQRLLRERIPSR